MFYVKNGIKYNKVVQMLKKAFSKVYISGSNVYECYKCCKKDREDIDNDKRTGCPNT